MKSIKIKIDTPYKKETANIYVSDTPITNSITLFTTICEAEATILDAMELIYAYHCKGRNKELQKVIEGVFDCLRNQIMQYNKIDKSEIAKIPFMEMFNASMEGKK